MFRNYLITAYRTLLRNRMYTALNVFGLALGMGCALVLFKVIRFETSFDKHHKHYDRIYRVVNHDLYPDHVDKSMSSPHPLGKTIREDYAELEAVASVHYNYDGQINVKKADGELDKFLLDEGLAFVDTSFFKVFTIDWRHGDQSTALSRPGTTVLSESMCRKLFKLEVGREEEAIGRVINYDNLKDFEVVGVIADPPKTTNFPFTILFEYSSQEGVNPYYYDGNVWNSSSSGTNVYLLTQPGFSSERFDPKLRNMVEKVYEEDRSQRKVYLTQPLSAVHFDETYGRYVSGTSIELIIALGFIGIFLVLTACINFINLATAQSANRSKEIGIRKAMGGFTGQLVVQFLSEIALITFTAMLMSLMIAELMFLLLEDILSYRLSLELLSSPITLVFISALFFVVTALSGFYPAILLSRMDTVLALKNKITAKNHSGGFSLRKGLVVVQFSISQFLIIGTLIVSAQMDYFHSKDLGFTTEAIVTSYLPERDEIKRERFKNELLKNAAISDVSFSLAPPTGSNNSHSNFNYEPLQSENSYRANFKPVDERYQDFFDLELLAGNFLSKEDSAKHTVINRKVADLMGFKDRYGEVIGEKLSSGWKGDKTIVGVVENFHTYSLDEELTYTLLIYDPSVFYEVSFKTSSTSKSGIKAALDYFRATWEEIYPEYVTSFDFLDDQIRERYELEESISTLMRIFSLISIVIGCLGLYGLISFVALNRVKEIGVRKVLGASALNILGLFSKETISLMLIAFIVACPIAYFTLDNWLQSYSYRISIGLDFFVFAFLATLIIALVTISHRTITSALINPATTLKDE